MFTKLKRIYVPLLPRTTILNLVGGCFAFDISLSLSLRDLFFFLIFFQGYTVCQL